MDIYFVVMFRSYRDCATDREGYQVHPPTAHLTSRPSPQCCEKHKQDINLQHLELTEVRKHRREADLRAAVATADRLLYKNGFIPRDVLTRIGTQQMYVRQSTYISVDTEPNVSSSSSSSSSRRSRKSSIYQKLPLSSSKIGATGAATGTGAFGTATASERRHSSSFLRTSSHHDSTTQSGPALVLSAHEQDANYQLLVESVLDRCLMDSREQSERLSWAGEKERRTRAANGREWQDRDHNEYLVNLKENQVMSLLNRTSTRSEKGNLSSNINSSRNMSGGTSSSSLLKSRTGRPISAYTLKNSLMRRLASIDGEHRRDTEAATTTGKAGTTGDVKSLPGLRGLAVAPAGESDIMGPAPDIIPQYDANRFVDITVKEYIEDE